MGGGAGITFEFWFESVDLTYHPYARLDTGVLTAKAQPRLIKFNARGYEDGMDCVRGDLWTVSDFSVVVPAESRRELAEYMGSGYVPQRAGDALYWTLAPEGGWVRDEPSYKEMIWGGWLRGDIRRVSFTPHGYVDIDLNSGAAIAWSCRLTPAEELVDWYEDVFKSWGIEGSGDWNSYDWAIYWDNVREDYGYVEPKAVRV